jgi:hypothetical protein
MPIQTHGIVVLWELFAAAELDVYTPKDILRNGGPL